MTSAEEKEMTLINLPNDNTLEALINEVEGRDQLVNLEKTIRYEPENLDQTIDERNTIFYETSSKNEMKAEDNKHKQYVINHDMKNVKKATSVRKRIKTERKKSKAHFAKKKL